MGRKKLKHLNSLGGRVATARKKLGLTQEKLGKESGLSRETIAKIETDVIKQPRNIKSLARALNVEPASLQYGSSTNEQFDDREALLPKKGKADEKRSPSKDIRTASIIEISLGNDIKLSHETSFIERELWTLCYPSGIAIEISIETATAMIMAANGTQTSLNYIQAEWPEDEFEKLLAENRNK